MENAQEPGRKLAEFQDLGALMATYLNKASVKSAAKMKMLADTDPIIAVEQPPIPISTAQERRMLLRIYLKFCCHLRMRMIRS
jgi:hypothetical protein